MNTIQKMESKLANVSYPVPSDVYYQAKLAFPTRLMNEYLLDNRGINENVTFLSYTYEEYSKLAKAPAAEDLLCKIIHNNPLMEL